MDQQQFAGEWPNDARLHALAMEYHRRTEDFDRQHCRRRVRGIAVPSSPAEGGVISRHARQVVDEIVAREHGCDDPEQFHRRLMEMIRDTGREFEASIRDQDR